MNENIEICFDSQTSTLYIGNIPTEQYQNKYRFKTSLENTYTLSKLYEYLGCKEAEDVGIKAKRDEILEFIDSKGGGEYQDNGTFKVNVEVDIPVHPTFNFIWVNATFEKNAKIHLNIDSQGKTSIALKQNIFKKSVKLNISNQCKTDKIDLSSNTFGGDFGLEWDEAGEIIFDKSKFLGESHFSIDTQENQFQNMNFKNCIFGEKDSNATINFKNCIFTKKVDFSNAKFEVDVDFHKAIFKSQAYFQNVVFQGNVYFSNVEFKEDVSFLRSRFEKTAGFYNATFEKPPNFSQAAFNGNLNLVNAKIDCDFKTLKADLESICQTSHTTQNIWHKIKNYIYSKICNTTPQKQKTSIDLEKLANTANDLRDSFRLCKNALIKENNLIDASQWHKLELYYKEIELSAKSRVPNTPVKIEKDIRRNTSIFQYLAEFKLLAFYRVLADHHTNTLRIINNLVLLIGLYALFLYMTTDYQILKIFTLTNTNNSIDNNTSWAQWFGMGFLIFDVIFIVMVLWNTRKYITLTLRIFRNDISTLFLPVLFLVCVVLLTYFSTVTHETLIIFAKAFCFVVCYILLLSSNVVLRIISLVPCYLALCPILAQNIGILHPLIGKLFDTNANKPSSEDHTFIALSFVYTILMILVLFSLQKTARKNSIVPH